MVTIVPMAWPSRTLKPAMERRALVMTAFWPLMTPRCAGATSRARALVSASPRPMFSTTRVTWGACIMLV